MLKFKELSAAEQRRADREAKSAEARARKAAALAAARTQADGPKVKARILKLGDGLVSTGEHAPGIGELCFEHGETPELPLPVAQALEALGYAEIED